jgi:phosphoglycolate phosphatase
MRFELVIFDLDGTLVDSCPDICNALNHVIQPFGALPVSLEETQALVGEGATRLMEKVVESRSLTFEATQLLDGFLAYYEEHLFDETTVYPGVVDALEALGGVCKAVVTNKHRYLTVRTLEALGLSRYFDVIVGSDTTPEKKPSPVPIRYVLDMFAVQPDRAVIVGDSTYDIEAGKNAGIATIAVTYGYRSAELLRGADALIPTMADLPAVLEKWEVGQQKSEFRSQ